MTLAILDPAIGKRGCLDRMRPMLGDHLQRDESVLDQDHISGREFARHLGNIEVADRLPGPGFRKRLPMGDIGDMNAPLFRLISRSTSTRIRGPCISAWPGWRPAPHHLFRKLAQTRDDHLEPGVFTMGEN